MQSSSSVCNNVSKVHYLAGIFILARCTTQDRVVKQTFTEYFMISNFGNRNSLSLFAVCMRYYSWKWCNFLRESFSDWKLRACQKCLYAFVIINMQRRVPLPFRARFLFYRAVRLPTNTLFTSFLLFSPRLYAVCTPYYEVVLLGSRSGGAGVYQHVNSLLSRLPAWLLHAFY